MPAKIIPFPFERTRAFRQLTSNPIKSMDDLPLLGDEDEDMKQFHRELNRMLGIIPPTEAEANEVTSPKTPRGA